jgi:hypothetical protein
MGREGGVAAAKRLLGVEVDGADHEQPLPSHGASSSATDRSRAAHKAMAHKTAHKHDPSGHRPKSSTLKIAPYPPRSPSPGRRSAGTHVR